MAEQENFCYHSKNKVWSISVLVVSWFFSRSYCMPFSKSLHNGHVHKYALIFLPKQKGPHYADDIYITVDLDHCSSFGNAYKWMAYKISGENAFLAPNALFSKITCSLLLKVIVSCKHDEKRDSDPADMWRKCRLRRPVCLGKKARVYFCTWSLWRDF